MSARTAPFAERLDATLSVPLKVGVVLGSGIKALEDLHEGGSSPYGELSDGFPEASVAGHQGVMSWGRLGPDGPGVMVARGRFHLYEGHGLAEALAIVNFFKQIGIPNVLLTNAAGGLRADWAPGDLMLITDHVNLQNLHGGYQAGYDHGLRPAEPYDAAWMARMRKFCAGSGLVVREGVYCGLLGPSYETMAENRMLQLAGCDAVGMSTTPEVARAASNGQRVLAVSCITNISVTPKGAADTSHEEVVDVAKTASEAMEKFLRGAIAVAE